MTVMAYQNEGSIKQGDVQNEKRDRTKGLTVHVSAKHITKLYWTASIIKLKTNLFCFVLNTSES